jgi:hypothetical protein
VDSIAPAWIAPGLVSPGLISPGFVPPASALVALVWIVSAWIAPALVALVHRIVSVLVAPALDALASTAHRIDLVHRIVLAHRIAPQVGTKHGIVPGRSAPKWSRYDRIITLQRITQTLTVHWIVPVRTKNSKIQASRIKMHDNALRYGLRNIMSVSGGSKIHKQVALTDLGASIDKSKLGFVHADHTIHRLGICNQYNSTITC